MARKSTLPEPRLFQLLRDQGRSEGRAEGGRTKAIETAGKLLEHGVPWDVITDFTGVKPADLKKAAAPARRKPARK